MLNDSLELALAAIAAAEAGPAAPGPSATAARAATKGLTASAFISAPPEEAGAAQTLEQVLSVRGWSTARDLKQLVCYDNPAGPITDALACQSFVFAILGRASDASSVQAEAIAAAKRLGKPIIPVVNADWEAMPKMAESLAGYPGVSLIEKTAGQQNATLDELISTIEAKVIEATS